MVWQSWMLWLIFWKSSHFGKNLMQESLWYNHFPSNANFISFYQKWTSYKTISMNFLFGGCILGKKKFVENIWTINFLHVHPWLLYFSITAILWNGWTKGGSLYCLANNYYPYIHTPNINPTHSLFLSKRRGIWMA